MDVQADGVVWGERVPRRSLGEQEDQAGEGDEEEGVAEMGDAGGESGAGARRGWGLADEMALVFGRVGW